MLGILVFMQLKKDAKRATKLVKRVLRGRKAFFTLREMLAERGELPENTYRIGVYFADSNVNIYQMRQWYAPLQELAKHHPVVVLARNVLGAKALIEESGLPVQYVPKVVNIEKFLEVQPLDVILYVNQNTRNFQMMRYGNRLHVFINHGESDKMYMTSNQHKCYDYALVAGDAAKKRLSEALWGYDVEKRTIAIGRPQADYFTGEPPFAADSRTVVLYSPTWEGDRPAASYGSVVSHGEQLVRRLIATGHHRVIYRPHPRTGVVDPEFGEANARIVQMLEEANKADPAAQHVYDQSATLGWQLRVPDVAICDISAMVYDRLATGKPIMITRPVNPEAEVDERGYLSVCDWLDAADCGQIDAVLARVLGDEEAKERLSMWSARYFGDTSQGEPTRRFHAAIEQLLAEVAGYRERAALQSSES